jgi:hypothetical protein
MLPVTVRQFNARVSNYEQFFKAGIFYELEQEVGNDKCGECLLFKDLI